jgi:hypothetical protein
MLSTGESWLGGYVYRQSCTITAVAGAGTNYPIFLNVYNSTAASTGTTCYIGTDTGRGGTINFADVRFTDDDGSTQLDYWMDSPTSTYATFWIEVKDSLETNQVIYVYYGKASDTTTSSGDNTFIFFDDFEDNSFNTAKWYVNTTIQTGSGTSAYSETGGKLYIDSDAPSDPSYGATVIQTNTAWNYYNITLFCSGSWSGLDYNRGGGTVWNAGLRGYYATGYNISGHDIGLQGSSYVYLNDYIALNSKHAQDVADNAAGTCSETLKITGTNTYSIADTGTYANSETGTDIGLTGATYQIYLWGSMQYWSNGVACDTYFNVVYLRKCLATEPAPSGTGA